MTRVTVATRRPGQRVRIVARAGEREVDAELEALLDDLLLLPEQERRAYPRRHLGVLHAGLGGELGHRLERVEKLGPAVGVAGIVDGVGADEDVCCAGRLGEREGVREEDRVAGGDVGDRNVWGCVGAALRDGDTGVRQGRAGEEARVDARCRVGHGGRCRERCCARELYAVPLAVVEGEGADAEAVGEG